MLSRVRLCLVIFIFLGTSAVASKPARIFDGFVTEKISPNEFAVGTRHVLCDAKTRLTVSANFRAETTPWDGTLVPVGSRVHVEGIVQKSTSTLLATKVEVTFTSVFDGPPGSIDGTGLIQQARQLHRSGQGWVGTLWTDGYPIQITPKTKLSATDGSSFSADQVNTNTWASYHATHNPGEAIIAREISFSANHVDQEEKEFRDRSEPQIDQPDYAKGIPGKLHLRAVLPYGFNIVPEKSLQDYVATVGESLIPAYQKKLHATDPTKIDFRFYVIAHPSKWKETLNDACGTASGVIFVPDNVLADLQNEAQLAALLSNSIAFILEKQMYNHRARLQAQKGVGIAALVGDFTPAAFITAPMGLGNSIAYYELMLQLNKRASRIGLTYMLDAGYDIREAPYAWTVAANEPAHNPLIEGARPAQVEQSMMDNLRLFYPKIDYASLKTNREQYQQMLVELRRVSPKLPKARNHA